MCWGVRSYANCITGHHQIFNDAFIHKSVLSGVYGHTIVLRALLLRLASNQGMTCNQAIDCSQYRVCIQAIAFNQCIVWTLKS